MDKDTLTEFESVFRQASESMEEFGLALLRMQKILEKERERDRLLGVTREVEDFEK